ncbi:hypothetical protein L596_024286 [Steinernema carpocapsae]|uniref:Uncharacterized protein n=1 Tax=Steinernema carpocapsae TaxID=34508 RepID=A0A4V5ZZN9_STECR|nr:hypothetical protein L596_024286 [Steinernema carpocapsae]
MSLRHKRWSLAAPQRRDIFQGPRINQIQRRRISCQIDYERRQKTRFLWGFDLRGEERRTQSSKHRKTEKRGEFARGDYEFALFQLSRRPLS